MIEDRILGLLDGLGEAETVALAGLAVGILFGVSAQRSHFCLRASVVEFARGGLGPRMAVWLLCFSTAMLWTQGMVMAGWLDLSEARWLAQPGSISGAVIGGLVFGAGMVLARGCPGRLLVLGATGNLRAILSGLVFAVTAQVALRGLAAPARTGVASLSLTDGPNPRLTDLAGLAPWTALALALAATGVALWLAARNRVSARLLWFGCGVGFATAAAWAATYELSLLTFDPTPVESLTFSGPSADTLLFVLLPEQPFDFDVGLVPGVALGAFAAAAAAGELRWQGWDGADAMRRSLTGAGLMGFGAMLAGGCSIGAGVSGASAMAFTAWLALASMWAGGVLTDLLLDRRTGDRPLATS